MELLLGVLKAAGMVGFVGLFIGGFLGIAAIKFKVKVDENEEAVLGLLPGNNCGGCGFSGDYEDNPAFNITADFIQTQFWENGCKIP